MARRRRRQDRPDQQAKIRPSPVNGQIPPAEFRWPKGVSGNPAGRVPGRNLKTILKRALDLDLDGLSVGEQVVTKLVSAALSGNLKAIQQILDQVEGLPARAAGDTGVAETEQPKRIMIPGADDRGSA